MHSDQSLSVLHVDGEHFTLHLILVLTYPPTHQESLKRSHWEGTLSFSEEGNQQEDDKSPIHNSLHSQIHRDSSSLMDFFISIHFHFYTLWIDGKLLSLDHHCLHEPYVEWPLVTHSQESSLHSTPSSLDTTNRLQLHMKY